MIKLSKVQTEALAAKIIRDIQQPTIDFNAKIIASDEYKNFYKTNPDCVAIQQIAKKYSSETYHANYLMEEIKKNVLDYEPHLALFVEDTDALLFYRKIAQLALKNLAPNGLLFFEINQYLGKETVELLENFGFKNIELKKDIYGNDRMIRCEK